MSVNHLGKRREMFFPEEEAAVALSHLFLLRNAVNALVKVWNHMGGANNGGNFDKVACTSLRTLYAQSSERQAKLRSATALRHCYVFKVLHVTQRIHSTVVVAARPVVALSTARAMVSEVDIGLHGCNTVLYVVWRLDAQAIEARGITVAWRGNDRESV